MEFKNFLGYLLLISRDKDVEYSIFPSNRKTDFVNDKI